MVERQVVFRFRLTGTDEARRELDKVNEELRKISGRRVSGARTAGANLAANVTPFAPILPPGGGGISGGRGRGGGGGAINPFPQGMSAAIRPLNKETEAREKSGLAISKSATGLLALSSVLGPLNSKLGQTVMTAGFAAFSYGAVAAAASLAAASTAGLAAILIGASKHAKTMGLETVKWSKSMAKLKTEFSNLQSAIGVMVQEAFEPLVQSATDVVVGIGKLPWDSIIDSTRAWAESLALVLTPLAKATAFMLEFEAAIRGFARVNEQGDVRNRVIKGAFKGLFGDIEGFKKEFKDAGKVFGGAFDSFFNQIDKFRDAIEDFEFRPKFDFTEVENVGKAIQKSIFKELGETREERAIKEGSDLQRLILQSTEANGRTLREQLELLRERQALGPALGP